MNVEVYINSKETKVKSKGYKAFLKPWTSNIFERLITRYRGSFDRQRRKARLCVNF